MELRGAKFVRNGTTNKVIMKPKSPNDERTPFVSAFVNFNPALRKSKTLLESAAA
jgi:hypothetical protein